MNIWNAYSEFAWPIFILHVILSIACVRYFVVGFLLLARERMAYSGLKLSDFGEGDEDNGSALSGLMSLTTTMARKGELLSPELIRARLIQSLARYDVLVRYCLNAFVISGLLGTLYNLWRLGPPFWASFISGQSQSAQPAIGIAFSASVFGLGLALFFSFVDSFVIRRPREELARQAAGDLFDHAVQALPPTEGAAVAEALQNFYSASEGFLTKLKEDHRELSQQFVKQIRDSSDQLTKTVGTVSDEWSILVRGATSSVEELGGRLGTQVTALTEATAGAAQTLGNVPPVLQEAGELKQTLIEIRAQANQLQHNIATRLGEFGQQWQEDLEKLTRGHVEQMEKTYSAGWRGYEERTESWNQQTTEVVKRFADGIEKSLSELGEERQQLAERVDSLINSWRQELGRSTTGVSSGLADLKTQIDSLKNSSSQLATSSDTVIQHLGDLERYVGSFSAKTVNGTPLGEAIDRLTKVVTGVKENGRSGGEGIPPVTGNDKALLQAILQELKALPASISLSIAMSIRRTQPETSLIPRGATEGMVPGEPSLWGRIIRIFKRRKVAL